jgi:hypothetical protein
VIRGALDHQEEQVALRRQLRGTRVALRGAQEEPQGGSKLGDPGYFGGCELTLDGAILVAGRANPAHADARHETWC